MKAVRAEEERVKEEERKEKYKIQRDKVIRNLAYDSYYLIKINHNNRYSGKVLSDLDL